MAGGWCCREVACTKIKPLGVVANCDHPHFLIACAAMNASLISSSGFPTFLIACAAMNCGFFAGRLVIAFLIACAAMNGV